MVLVGNSANVLIKKKKLSNVSEGFSVIFFFEGFADNPAMNRWYLNFESECSVSNVNTFYGF